MRWSEVSPPLLTGGCSPRVNNSSRHPPPQLAARSTFSNWALPNQTVVLIRPASDVCGPTTGGSATSVGSSGYGVTFNATASVDAALLAATRLSQPNAVALVVGSSCLFDTYAAYQADALARVREMD